MKIIENQTDYLTQNKITSKEIVIDSLLKRFEQLTEELEKLSTQIKNTTNELDTLTESFENSPSDQESVTQNAFLQSDTPQPSQPESPEDVE